MDDYVKITMSSVSSIVNINSAKKLAFVFVLVALVVKSIDHFETEPCERLLKGGSLVDDKTWQPDGCMLHLYEERDARECLKRYSIAFVGDSRLREIFYTLIDFSTTSSFNRPEKAHSDLSFDNDEMHLNFYWIPEINQSAMSLYENWEKDSNFPDVIIQAAGTHTIKRSNGSLDALDSYRTNLTALFPLMKKAVDKKSEILWIMQEPVLEQHLHEARRAITNEQLNRYNRIASSLFETPSGRAAHPGIFPVRSFAAVGSQLTHTMYDGLHHGEDAKQHIMQIFLNSLCNRNRSEFGICCQPPPHPTVTQIIAFAVGCLCVLGAILGKLFIKVEEVKGEKGETAKQSSGAALKELIDAAARMSIILFYFYICDRTNIFMRSNKHYAHVRFFIPLLYVFFLGMFGFDKCKTPSLLNRDQTDEWKGWMQLVILIYHVTGASANVSIYMHIRLLVAMYLFMTGYGHFSYFWNKGDFRFFRVLNVLFRLNFLTVMLCIVMDRSYQFYYYVPLCTFWFLVLYLSMAAWPRAYESQQKNNTYDSSSQPVSPVRVMSFKLLALTISIVLLFISQKVFEFLFSWWPVVTLFEHPRGSVREWWFRCQLDRFAMLHGALFCFAYLILKRLSIVEDSKQGCLLSTKGSLVSVTSAVVVVLAYMLWAVQCTDKVHCNHVHSYVSFLPISAFILIRNIPGYLRSHYSSFFAWFGKISLELFIGQYHIWLAADTRGVLVLGPPGYPTANLVLGTFVFVCVAHEINHLTGIFAKHYMGSSKDGDKQALTHFLITVAVLLAIQLPSYFLSDVLR